MCPPHHRETEGGGTYQVHGAKLWNGILLEIHKKDTIRSFSLAMKTHFLA